MHRGAKVACIYGYTSINVYDATCPAATGTATCNPKSCTFRDTDGQTKTVDQLTLPKCWKGSKRLLGLFHGFQQVAGGRRRRRNTAGLSLVQENRIKMFIAQNLQKTVAVRNAVIKND
ncbi:hypothetical protein O181_093369 [Austropuccinia psidii MF-1]|uniref:Uncharacterized protein n=1 Tax=Austropuccinia psidii MF-1 TaxID=1389203 RepID=A0A9Q3P9S0_9BASI|nr:hypothetical protein [Austropuccinia psidii MF-1]